MSDDDPWKNWYQADQPPAGVAGSDATRDMTSFSQLPPPGSGQDGGAGRAWPQQPPPVSSGAPGSQYGGGGSAYGGGSAGSGYGGAVGYGGAPPGTWPARSGRRRRFWGQPGRHGRRIVLVIVVVLVLILAGVGGTYFWLNGKLHRTVSLPAFTGTSAGTNWLIAGSDTRDGITRAERATLHLGSQGANASDSLMLLHMGTGKPVLISIPRDSYVPIPGHGENKINAALAFGRKEKKDKDTNIHHQREALGEIKKML